MAWLKAGEKKKGAKYIARVELKGKKNKYRYFYDQDEYDAYLKEQEEDDDDSGSIFDKIKNTVKSAASSVKDAVDKGEETIKKTASDVADKASDTATSIKSSLKKTTEELKDTVDEGKNIVEKTMKKAAEKVSEAKTSVEDVVEDTTKDIKKALNSTTKEIKETVDKGSETVKKFASDTTKDIQNTVSKGASFVSDTVEKTKDVSLTSIGNSKSIVDKAGEFISDFVSDVADNPLNLFTWSTRLSAGITNTIFDAFDDREETTTTDTNKTDTTDTNDVSDTSDENDRSNLIDPNAFYDKFVDILNLKDGETTAEEDQEAINPQYNPFDIEYSWNCAYCTAAYELRRRGYDVEAMGVDENTYNDLAEIASWYEDPDISQSSWDPYDSASLDKAVSDLTSELASEGDGARGQFCIYWADGGGHSVVWEVDDGEVVLRDCQNNQTVSLYDYMQYGYEVQYFRTDNIELTDEILKTVRNV